MGGFPRRFPSWPGSAAPRQGRNRGRAPGVGGVSVRPLSAGDATRRLDGHDRAGRGSARRAARGRGRPAVEHAIHPWNRYRPIFFDRSINFRMFTRYSTIVAALLSDRSSGCAPTPPPVDSRRSGTESRSLKGPPGRTPALPGTPSPPSPIRGAAPAFRHGDRRRIKVTAKVQQTFESLLTRRMSCRTHMTSGWQPMRRSSDKGVASLAPRASSDRPRRWTRPRYSTARPASPTTYGTSANGAPEDRRAGF